MKNQLARLKEKREKEANGSQAIVNEVEFEPEVETVEADTTTSPLSSPEPENYAQGFEVYEENQDEEIEDFFTGQKIEKETCKPKETEPPKHKTVSLNKADDTDIKHKKQLRTDDKLIVFTSCLDNVGATSIAVSLGKYLSDNGANVCYVELRKGMHTSNIFINADDDGISNQAVDVIGESGELLSAEKISPLIDVYGGLHIIRNSALYPCRLQNPFDVILNLADFFDNLIVDVDVETLLMYPDIAYAMDFGYYVTAGTKHSGMQELMKLNSYQKKFGKGVKQLEDFKLVLNKSSVGDFKKYYKAITDVDENCILTKLQEADYIEEFKAKDEFMYLGKYINSIRNEVTSG